jgi:hypothetical protein
MSPYADPVTKITDVSPYFEKKPDGSMVFIGKTLEARIPRKFSRHGMLTIGDGSVSTLGVMDLIIDGKYQTGLNLLTIVTIEPSDISYMTYDGLEYVVLKLETNDTFLTSTRVIRSQKVVFVLWDEFITRGGAGYWFDYDALLKLFEHVQELTGGGIGVSRSAYEGVVAHIARVPGDLTKQYRRTDMSGPMKLIPLKSISLATTGTIARLNGSYFRDEGTVAALAHDVTQVQPFEQLMRGISSSAVEGPDRAIL